MCENDNCEFLVCMKIIVEVLLDIGEISFFLLQLYGLVISDFELFFEECVMLFLFEFFLWCVFSVFFIWLDNWSIDFELLNDWYNGFVGMFFGILNIDEEECWLNYGCVLDVRQ